MVTPAAIVTGAQGVSIASARLDAVGEASVMRVSRRPHAGRPGYAGSASVARVSRRTHAGRPGHAVSASVARAAPVAPAARALRLGRAGRTRAPPTMSIVSARAVKRWGPLLNVWSRFASFPRCASRLH